MLSVSQKARPAKTARRGGFTLVELLVVVTVIALILAIAVPALSSIGRQARETAAAQLVSSSITRAFYTAIGNRSLAAVRFFPGAWDFEESRDRQRPAGRQHLAIYRYSAQTENPASGGVVFYERFVQLEQSESVALPEGVWAAPLESLSRAPYDWQCVTPESGAVITRTGSSNLGRDLLRGRIHSGASGFGLCPTPCYEYALSQVSRPLPSSDYAAWGEFLHSDDFLIVIDANTGVRPALRSYALRAYDPIGSYRLQPNGAWFMSDSPARPKEWDVFANPYPIMRLGFSGVVTYAREPFLSLGRGSAPEIAQQRQDWLIRNAKPYMPLRTGGGVVIGAPPAPQN